MRRLAPLLVLALAASAEDAWWDPAYACRRAVRGIQAIAGRHPSDACVVTFTTAGACQPSLADIRVVARGEVVPHRVVSTGDEDRVTIIFEAKDPKAPTWVYFGNRNASPPRDPYEPRAGLLLETRETGEGTADSWERFQALFQASPVVMGRGLARTISMGFNPYGRQYNYIAAFSGYLYVPAFGRYEFATNSWDASFIVIDGRVVVAWPGIHPPNGAYGQHHGAIDLAEGIHRIEYFNAVSARGQGCICGWKPPGQAQWTAIPETAFVGGYRATAGPLERRGKTTFADFDWAITSDLGLEGQEVTAVQFRESLPRGMKARDLSWDFGDGIEGAGSKPRHVYLENGPMRVRLRVTLENGESDEVTQTVRVQPFWAMGSDGAEKRMREYHDIVKGYSPYAISPAAAMQLAWLFLQMQKCHDAVKAYAGAFARMPPIETQRVAEHAFRYGDLLTLGYGDGALAAPHYAYVARTAKDTVWKVCALVRRAEALLERDGALAEAREALEEAMEVGKGARTDYLRWARIRLADVALLSGDREGAERAYREIQFGRDSRVFRGDPGMAKGDHVLTFEKALRTKDLETALGEIRQLEWEQPLERLTGLPDWMRARLLLLQGREAEGAIALERALAAAPRGTYAAASLLMLGDLEAKRDAAKARARWEAIVAGFPESPEAKTAARRLAEQR